MSERRYQMIRVRAGVYLLPSNDRQTLWRISSYGEYGDAAYSLPDGSLQTIKGTFWEAARHDTPLDRIAPHLIGGDDDGESFLWDEHWQSYSSMHRTRAEAIDEALGA